MSGTSPPRGPDPKTLLPRPWYRFWPEAAILALLALVVVGIVAVRGRHGRTVVAIRDIAKGTEIEANDLGTAPLPHIEGIIVNADDVVGGVAQEPIGAGSPFFVRAVARSQAFAAVTIRSGALVTADSVTFKLTPFVEDAVTSPASLRRRAAEEIPAGSAVRESMFAEKGSDDIGTVKRDLAPGQVVIADDVAWTPKPPCDKPVATSALFSGDHVRADDVVCVGAGNVIAAYRVFIGTLRPRRGSTVVLLPASKEVTKAEAQLLSITPSGDGATVIVALPPAEAERLAPVSDKPLQLLAKSGG